MGEAPMRAGASLRTAVLGFPRFGPDRELKHALEAYWRGKLPEDGLESTAGEIRAHNRSMARASGIDVIPCNDFSRYDHVLDAGLCVGAIERATPGLDGEFALARGGPSGRPLEMTKWFDTNYHYLVPEIDPTREFALDARKPLGELAETLADGDFARPVILGPFSLLRLAKSRDPARPPLARLPELVPVYAELLRALHGEGARAVQLDEPCLVFDLDRAELEAAERSLGELVDCAPGLELTLATYFGDLGEALDPVMGLGFAEVHLDLVLGSQQLAPALRAACGSEVSLSLGIVDGRNVWVTDPDPALATIDAALELIGPERVRLAPSCSLLHVPYSASRETGIEAGVRGWLAFCEEKLDEVSVLARAALAEGSLRSALVVEMAGACRARRESSLTNRVDVRARVEALETSDTRRDTPFSERVLLQRAALGLPELPTTTIGSFPQTPEIRDARRLHRDGGLSDDGYRELMAREIRSVVAWQEGVGLDVLVHGEPERNDMVQYFAEQLDGFAVTEHGWVQSYGSRGVKPPILFGDVGRPVPMTVDWWRIAQDATDRPVKGMLTGPVTMLRWSFVRDDQTEAESAWQVALAIRDEVGDLERAGARIIQIDEAAFREGLPLRESARGPYLEWATAAFRLCGSGVHAETQIHSHMCYSEFNEIIEHIADLDADVISIEASRSGMELLEAFRRFDYPAEIGPGVYDIHSPRRPDAKEMEALIALAEEHIPRQRLWVNPDCGLKTRSWAEVRAAITGMVAAARRRRTGARVGMTR